MRIIYSPGYDSEKLQMLSSADNCMIDTIYAGDKTLLSQLQLRLGLTAPTVSNVERQAYYMLSVRRCRDKAFYALPAMHDEMGTARRLLCWRDDLLMCGWTPDMHGISQHLNDLSDLDKGFDIKGTADLWCEIKDFTKDSDIRLDGIDILVDCSKCFIPLVVRQTLDNISRLGASVTYKETLECKADSDTALYILQQHLSGAVTDAEFKDDGTISILSFNNPEQAYEWFISKHHEAGTVVVNHNTTMLNYILRSWDKPLVKASAEDANPQIPQLFKLGLSLFLRPLNIKNLICYLQQPVHPLQYKLRRKLADALTCEGGMDDKWTDAIKDYIFDEDENKNIKIRNEKEIFWKPAEYDADEINLNVIIEYNEALLKWAETKMHIGECSSFVMTQLGTLASFCRAFATSVTGLNSIDGNKLIELIRSIYRTSDVIIQTAQKDSVAAVTNIYDVKDSCRNLVWLDCNARNVTAYKYDFLSTEERDALSKLGVEVPDYDTLLQLERFMMLRSLCRVKHKLTIVSTVYEGNDMAGVHPIKPELQLIMGSAFKVCTPDADTSHMQSGNTDNRKPQLEYNIERSIDIPQREHSFSSLENLIQQPFDYLMNYVLRMKEPVSDKLGNLNLIKGNVAHLFVQQLCEDGNNEISEVRRLYVEEFEERAERALTCKGAIMNLDENRTEKLRFITILKKSIESLITIIEQKNLKIVGCEKKVDVADITGIGPFSARIDCLLMNSQGNYVVFDFKWSDNIKYPKYIADNLSMQLALYKWAVEHGSNINGSVVAVGYYLFPKCCLYTSGFETSGDIICNIPVSGTSSELEDKIMKSIEYRKNQFKEGRIEEAGGFLLEDIPYYNDCGEEMYPLECDKSATKNKKSAYPAVSFRTKRSNNKDLQERPTSHTILKARVK